MKTKTIIEKIKNVSGEMNEQTTKLIKRLCHNNEWTCEVLECDVNTFENRIADILEEFGNLSDFDKNEYIGIVLDALPQCLHFLEKGEAKRFINAVGRACISDDETVGDDIRFEVICILRIIANDIISKSES